MKGCCWIVLLAFLGVHLYGQGKGEVDLYVLRHAETLANSTGKNTEANQRRFSPLGETQVAGVQVQLAQRAIGAILVSPSYRARHTILPWLLAQGRVAEVWPELDECCWIEDGGKVPDALEPQGSPLYLEPEDRPYFRFRGEQSPRAFSAARVSDGEAQVRAAIRLLEERFRGSDKTILVVTHFHSGSRLVERLLGDAYRGRVGLRNAALTHLRRQADGTFRLLRLNGLPAEGAADPDSD